MGSRPIPERGFRSWPAWLLLVGSAWLPAAEPGRPVAEATGLPVVAGEILHANSLEFGILAIRDVVATPAMADQVLRFEPCTGTAYGGTVSGAVAVDLRSGSYRLRIDLAKAGLETFLHQVRGNPSELRGQVAGWVELEVPEGRGDRLAGRGELHLTSGSLVHFPLLANLLVGDPGGAKDQDTFDAAFTIGDGKVTLTEAVLRSPAATIGFSGTITLDGELEIEIRPDLRLRFLEAATAGTINRVLAPIGRSAARAVLVGQVTNPVLVLDPFGLGGR